MRRITACFAIGCAIAAAIFTGAARAGDEHGRSDGQGQAQAEVKQDDSAQAQTESHGQPQSANESAPGQTKKADALASLDTSSSVSAGAGVKPSSTTAHGPHWTHCTTGRTTGAATCSPVGANAVSAASVQGDVSKRYGNSETAAQIVVKRGGGVVTLTGPGNSQPHKVNACGKPGNPSGGVDVHAVKTYDASACATTHPSEHVQSSTGVPTQSSAAVQSSTPSSTSASIAAHSSAGNGTTSATSPHGSGAVLEAGTTVGKPKATQTSSSHGVLGEVANVAGSALPFTGFPLWLAGVAGLLLVATGLTLRRRTHTAA